MTETLLILLTVLLIYSTYQVIIITKQNEQIDKRRKELEQEYLFKYKATLLVIDQLETIKNFEIGLEEQMDIYIRYNQRLSKSFSEALTEIQLQQL